MKRIWDHVEITINNEKVKAISPLIISASRSTDIPAFYSEWLLKRLEAGYVKWVNPFNQKAEYVSLKNARVFVFWSKNPEPLIEHLPEFDRKGIGYYVQFTLNDYEKEGFEPNLPPLEKRIATFKKLSQTIGKKKVIWRFDPLILGGNLNLKALLEKIKKVGGEIHSFTEKLVFSFADIAIYQRVKNNLKRARFSWEEWREDLMQEMAKGIMELNSQWGLRVSTCAEKIDLKRFGITPNKCIDDELMKDLFPDDNELMDFLGFQNSLFPGQKLRCAPKDPGQRPNCGCIISKDIGQYNTCPHQCVYCYANSSPSLVKKNFTRHKPNNDAIISAMGSLP